MLGFVITSQPVGSRAALSTTPGAAALCWWGRGAAESPQPLVQQLLPRGPYSTSRSVPQQQEAECSSPVPGSRAGLGCAALLPAICTRRAGKTPGGCREEVVQVLFSFGWLVLSCELCRVQRCFLRSPPAPAHHQPSLLPVLGSASKKHFQISTIFNAMQPDESRVCCVHGDGGAGAQRGEGAAAADGREGSTSALIPSGF